MTACDEMKNVPPNASILFVCYSVIVKKHFDDIKPQISSIVLYSTKFSVEETLWHLVSSSSSKMRSFAESDNMKHPGLEGAPTNFGFELVVHPSLKLPYVGTSTLFSSYIQAYFFMIIK